ncbi:bacterial regulatory s, tetR family protein [Mycobacterium kansasii]|uniref:Bacterial regulatory s, tetR family protein n=1 Tax=Mycobacterium kansasii TaxID=1768 RepID=A0A1V3XT10_MYCKA|nr:bacterial regulatory s, tetR family protein [Mycobacterium kansasii]
MRRRGDKHRQAILQAVRELLQERPFAELSVSTISNRAGVARSGFYFYFDSKYAVLAQILAEAAEELEELTHYFAPRQPGESPQQFAKRMVGSAAVVYAHNDPVIVACNAARHTDIEIREILEQQFDVVLREIVGVVEAEMRAGTANPISDDLPTLIRTLAGTTALVLTGDPLLVGRDSDPTAGCGCSNRCGSTRFGAVPPRPEPPVSSPPWRNRGITQGNGAWSPVRLAASAVQPHCGSRRRVPNSI